MLIFDASWVYHPFPIIKFCNICFFQQTAIGLSGKNWRQISPTSGALMPCQRLNSFLPRINHVYRTAWHGTSIDRSCADVVLTYSEFIFSKLRLYNSIMNSKQFEGFSSWSFAVKKANLGHKDSRMFKQMKSSQLSYVRSFY